MNKNTLINALPFLFSLFFFLVALHHAVSGEYSLETVLYYVFAGILAIICGIVFIVYDRMKGK